jgi:Protein of unknown function (DUF3618)
MAQEPNQVEQDSAPADTAPSSSPATREIRSQIEHTRAEMSQTIDAIQARLSPSRLMTDAKETVKEATVGRVKRFAAKTAGALGNGERGSLDAKRLLEVVKSNPIPVAMVGIAATALTARVLMRSRNASTRAWQHGAAGAEERQRPSNGLAGNKRRLLVGACAGLACWSAWRANSHRGVGDSPGRVSADTSQSLER